jgi:hypothetical protein
MEQGMVARLIVGVLVAIFTTMLAGSVSAQQPDSNLNAEDQLSPSQMKQPNPGAVAAPPGGAQPAKHTAASPGAAPAKTAAPVPPGAPKTVTCVGAFSKDSSNLRLAMTFDSKNVTFADVDVNGTKVQASIVFPKDPKRRLEVWWANPANRSDTYLILINGQSAWVGPDGLKLGLTLADLEKLNHKPFKLKGFDKDNIARISDWDGGALTTIAGGCKTGVSLQADPKTPAEALSPFPADQEFSSTDAGLRATKPKVSEILIGYQ